MSSESVVYILFNGRSLLEFGFRLRLTLFIRNFSSWLLFVLYLTFPYRCCYHYLPSDPALTAVYVFLMLSYLARCRFLVWCINKYTLFTVALPPDTSLDCHL